MARVFAFLRAINVGGHVVTMAELRRLLGDLDQVETFIASGNVTFLTTARSLGPLERRIAAALEKGLGYPVATFLRSAGEVAVIAGKTPFSKAEVAAARAINVGFFQAPLAPAAAKAVLALQTDLDTLRLDGRELHWLCRGHQAESRIAGSALERALGGPVTFRNVRTIARLVARYGLAPGAG